MVDTEVKGFLYIGNNMKGMYGFWWYFYEIGKVMWGVGVVVEKMGIFV